MKRAMIALSGGVDSAVAAYLTQQQGYECLGATMLLWENSDADARKIAQKLQMPFYLLDGRNLFASQVVEPFIQAYEQGLTPNPCIRCNQHLKFSYFLEQAQSFGCEKVVTGHYAQIRQDRATGRYLLYKAADRAKDQTYFLAGLTQHQLSHALFPLGTLTKEQARQIASDQGFINAQKKDSQDICFIPDGDYKAFMERYSGKQYPCGDFLDTQGQVVGRHKGAVGYTLGQRKGLGLAMGQPVYVCQKDMDRNTVTVGPESLLYTQTLWAANCNFLPFETLTAPLQVTAKARSRHTEQPATVYPEENGIRVEFATPQRAVTPGQAVVLYDGDTVIASGTITHTQ